MSLPNLNLNDLVDYGALGLISYINKNPSDLDHLLSMYNFLRDEYLKNTKGVHALQILKAFTIFKRYLKNNPKNNPESGSTSYYYQLKTEGKIDNKGVHTHVGGRKLSRKISKSNKRKKSTKKRKSTKRRPTKRRPTKKRR